MENASHSPEILQHFLDERRVEDAFRREVLALFGAEKRIAEAVVSMLRPSANTLRDIFRLTAEICRRDRVSWESLYAAGAARSALDPERNVSAKDRAKELKRYLETLRYPETAGIESELEACRKELARDTGLCVSWPQDLEGDELSVTLEFSTPAELGELAENSAKLAAHPALARIFRLLKGCA